MPLNDLVNADDLKAIEALTGTSGLLKKTANNTWTLDTNAYTTSSGVTSVRVQATSPVVSSVNTAQTSTLNTTISLADNYGDTKNPYASKTARYVLAAPATAAGAPTFRALTNADVGLGNVENTKLSTWAGSGNITTIGTLTSGTVPWARLSGVPSTMTPSSHTHGNITNDGKIGTAANQAAYTTTNGVVTAGTLPAAAGGTGKTTLKDAANALINALDTGGSALTANDYVITQYVGGGTTTTTYHRRPASALRVGGLLTARTFTIGSTGKTFDGTGNVSWTLAEIGAAAASHNHDSTYVNVSGDTMTGALTLSGDPTSAKHAATKQYVDQSFAANDAMIFKGTIGSSGATVTALPNTHSIGWTYRVLTAGTYAGVKCEVGDLVICITDGTTANNAHWTVAQTNIDGAVVGPASATNGNIALFDGTTGKIIKNSSYSPSSFAAASHTHSYLPLAGGTMTGVLKAYANQYTDNYTTCGINMQNSDIVGLNSIYTADASDNAGEGIHFYRDSTHVDTLWMNGGDILFVPNRALGTSTTKANSQKVGRFTANPTSGQVVITDGTTGGMKSSGYTIAASVPSGAKFTDTTYSAGTGISLSGTTFSNSGVTGVKGNAESSYRTGQVNLTPANIGAVALSGDETVSGNKTFSGQTKLSTDSVYAAGANTKIVANSVAIIQSPIPKYLWHDLFAFSYKAVPTYYITTNNSTWTEATLDKRPFAQKENFGYQIIKATGQTGSRWVWHNDSFSYSFGVWLVIGVTYASPVATVTITFDTSSDGSTWTTRFTNTHNGSSAPIWCYLNSGGYGADTYLRLTITKDASDTTKIFNINAIKLLSPRWGDQGGGSEYEYPYSWDENKNVTFPAKVTATTLAGNLDWSYIQSKPTLGTLASKSTISNHSVTTPTGATSRTANVELNTTTVNSITAVGTLPSLTVTATDVVTGGTTTAIPNISKKTVVTGVTKKTVVTGGSTTAVPNISKKTVVTSATAAKATYSSGILTISDGSVTTGDSVTVGTAINAYTSLTTGDSVTVTTGDSVTVGTAINAYTALTTSSIGSASGWSAGTLPTKGSNTTVATGIKTQPTFTVTTTTTTLSHTIS